MDPRLEELVKLAMSGRAVDYRSAIRQLDDIKSGMSSEESSKVDEDFQDMMTDAAANAAGGVDDQMRRVIKGSVAANMTLGALKAGAGIFQIIDANAKKKGLNAPEFPELQAKNSKLSNRIADAQVRAEQGDQAIRSQYEQDLAQLDALYNKRAQSAGNAGQYMANVQSNALATKRDANKFAAEESQRRAGYRREYDSLLGMDIQENNIRQQEKWKRFNVLNDRYETTMANLTAQSNAGVENMFTGLDQLASGGAGLPLLKRKTDVSGNVDTPGGMIDDTLPMDLGTISRMGSPSFRMHNPMEVIRLQKLGGVDQSGVWDEDTQDFFNSITNY